MTSRTKPAVLASALALAVFALWLLSDPSGDGPAVGADHEPGAGSPLTAEASPIPQDSVAEMEREQVDAERNPEKTTPTTGSLIVKATYEVDGEPVPDLVVMVGPPGADHRVSHRRGRTNAEGVVRFDNLPAGRIWVQNVRHDDLIRTSIESGSETEAAIALPKGITVTGIVVDMHGVAVPGAEVILAPQGRGDRNVEHVTDTDAEGRFHLASCPKCFLGARAKGHAPSRLHSIQLEEGASTEIRIELPAPGGGVTGVVRASDGSPIRDAGVHVGKSRLQDQLALVRTDAKGRFHAIGIAAGEHAIEVRAADFAPWRGSCLVRSGTTTTLDVQLLDGVSCAGMVVDDAGAPLAKVEIQVGSHTDLAHYRTFSGKDGTFRLDGLPVGEFEIRAAHRKHGAAKTKLRGAPGETVKCRLVMDLGLELRGRVLTAGGKPVHRAFVDAREREVSKDFWGQHAVTDAKGEFRIVNCPKGRLLTVGIRGRGVRDKRIDDVDPRNGELVVTLEPAPLPSARLVGKIVRPDGKPAAYAGVWAWEREGGQTGTRGASQQGVFAAGPLVPGEWHLIIRAEGLPPFVTAWRTLTANETADLGTIRLVAGGTVRVEVQAPDDLAPRMSLRTGSRWNILRGKGSVRQSDLVPPGRAYISVSGTGVATQLVPVEVKAGAETRATVKIEAGYEQVFRFSDPKTPSMRRVRITNGERTVADLTSRARIYKALPAKWRRWLAPGEYVVTVDADGLRGQVRFTVRAGRNDVVKVDMK